MTETFLSEENSIIQEIEDKSLPIPFDPLKKYLAEISKHPVLSREEEYELAEKIHKNKDIEAAQKMVISNLKLVVKIALEYYNTYLNILDLIQEGNVGLLQQKLEALGVFPAPQLLASTLDVTEEEVESMQKRLAYTDISLETPVHEEGDDTLMDMIKTGDNVEEIVTDREMDSMLSERVAEFKKDLNEKELFIFEHRIMTDESMTLQEIGEKFKISRERVRQIENKVLNRFKARFKQELKELDF